MFEEELSKLIHSVSVNFTTFGGHAKCQRGAFKDLHAQEHPLVHFRLTMLHKVEHVGFVLLLFEVFLKVHWLGGVDVDFITFKIDLFLHQTLKVPLLFKSVRVDLDHSLLIKLILQVNQLLGVLRDDLMGHELCQQIVLSAHERFEQLFDFFL